MTSVSPLRLYNTLAKREEVFQPAHNKEVSMYTCGPTVYGRPHIGNYSSFLMADLLRRWLEVSGYTVKHVKNITDVGHLVADADTGEDKVEKEARRIAEEKRGKGAVVAMADVLAVAEMYTRQYLEDELSLHILEPTARPRASEYVAQMIVIIQELLAKGHAYETDDGIYFDVQTFTEYGKLSGNTLDQLNAGARVSVDEEKKHPADFALWKKCVGHNAQHVLRWTSPWGEGFPGWHIECSAMSRTILGEQIDLHTGGADNIFPHHECETAQSEASSGKKPFVRMWVHRRRVDIGDQKMSKSLGNVLSISDIIEKGFSPLDLRYYLLSVHYRTNLKFSWKGMEDTMKARRKIMDWMGEMEKDGKEGNDGKDSKEDAQNWSAKFADAMNADLNVSEALAVIFDCMSWSRNVSGFSANDRQGLLMFIDEVRRTFGCFDPEEVFAIPADIQALVDARAAARASKDFAESDRLRDEISKKGFEVKDTGEGQKVRKM
ncbi:MAG: cysteine--tRNA ligase [Candidatus Peregrinibacteria bacterium]